MANFTKKHGARSRAALGLLGAAAMLLAALGVSSCKGDSGGSSGIKLLSVSLSVTDQNEIPVTELATGQRAYAKAKAIYDNGDEKNLNSNCISMEPAQSGAFSKGVSGNDTVIISANEVEDDATVTLKASYEGKESSAVVITIKGKVEQLVTPTFEINAEGKLEIHCATTGAKIFYTTNGDEPTKESEGYKDPIDMGALGDGAVVKATAVKGVNTLETPASVKVWTVTFKKEAADAEAFATKKALDGSAIEAPDAPEKAGWNFNFWSKEGESANFDFSSKITESVTLVAQWTKGDSARTPTIAWDESDEFALKVQITGESGAEIWYTTNGSAPDKDKSAGTKYTAPFAISETSEVKATAYEEGKNPSEPAVKTMSVFTVTFETGEGASKAPDAQKVRAGGKAKKPANPTKEDSSFASWLKNGESFNFDSDTISANATLTAKWTAKGRTADPTISWAADGSATVVIECATTGSKIYYTTDGSDPVVGKGEYTAPIQIGATTKVSAIACAEGKTNSEIISKECKVFTVTFKKDTGDTEAIATQKTRDGGKAKALPEDPEKAGFKFAGWTKGGESFDIANDTIGADTTLVASWDALKKMGKPSIEISDAKTAGNAAKITISFATADDARASGAKILYTTNGSDPTAGGLEFAAPFEISDTTTVKAVARATGRLDSAPETVEAKIWSVTFNVGSGATGAPAAQKARDGGHAKKPADPSKDKNRFAGWLKGGEAFSFDTDVISADTELAAKWELLSKAAAPVIAWNDAAGAAATTNFVKITADGAKEIWYTTNGDAPTSTASATNKKYTVPFEVTDTATIRAMATSATLNDSDITDFAAKIWSVTFALDGGTGTADTQKVRDGGRPAKPADPTKESNTFSGWFAEGATNAFNFASAAISANTALTAHWTDNGTVSKPAIAWGTGNTVTIESATAGAAIHYTTDGSAPTVASETYSAPISVSASAIIKAIAIKSGLHDSALSEFKANFWSVEFRLDGGDGAANAQTVRDGLTAAAPVDPTKDGYDFAGWRRLVGSAPESANFNFASAISANTILKAQWTAWAQEAQPVIEWEGSELNVKITAAKGASIRYTTDGSAPSKTAGTEYTGPFAISASATVKAVAWSAKTALSAEASKALKVYTVTFKREAGDTTPFATQKVRDGGKATEPAAPTKDGHDFAGWKNGSSTFSFSASITADTTLTADWAAWEAMGKPVFSVGDAATAGKVAKVTISLAADDKSVTGAEIWYTTNGDAPTSTASAANKKYTAPIEISDTTTFKAAAFAPRKIQSAPETKTVNVFTVTFKESDKATTAFATQKVREGGKAAKPATDPAKDGSAFDGWMRGSDKAAFNFDTGAAISANTEFTAKWTDWTAMGSPVFAVSDATTDGKVAKVTISFAEDDMSVAGKTIRYTTGASAAPTATTGTLYEGPIEISDTTTFKAVAFAPQRLPSDPATMTVSVFTVTFKESDKATTPFATQKVRKDGKAKALAADPTKEENDFNGWKNGEENFNIASDTISANTTLVASWTEWAESPMPAIEWATTGAKFVITCSWGGTVPAGAEIRYTTDGTTPTRKAGTKYTAGSDIALETGSTTVKAVAYADKRKLSAPASKEFNIYTVTFDVGSGTGTAPATQTVREGDKASAPDKADNPTKADNDFAGWFADLTDDDAFDFAKSAITADITLTAKFTPWKQAPTPAISCRKNKVTITVAWGDETPDGATIRYTTDGSAPSKTNGTEYTAPFAITANTTVKAVAYADNKTLSEVAEEECAFTAPGAGYPRYNFPDLPNPQTKEPGSACQIFYYESGLDVQTGDWVYFEATVTGANCDKYNQCLIQSRYENAETHAREEDKCGNSTAGWCNNAYSGQVYITEGFEDGYKIKGYGSNMLLAAKDTQDVGIRFIFLTNPPLSASSGSDKILLKDVFFENRGPIDDPYYEVVGDLSNDGDIGKQGKDKNGNDTGGNIVEIPFATYCQASGTDQDETFELTFAVRGASNYQQLALQTDMNNYSDYYSLAVMEPGIGDGLLVKVTLNREGNNWANVKGPFAGKLIFQQLDANGDHPGFVYDKTKVSNIEISNLTVRNLKHPHTEPAAEWAGNDGSAYNATANALAGIDGGAVAFANNMGVGWNLGNNLDPADFEKKRSGEGLWNNPLTNKAIINAVKQAGFDTIRIPITWLGWIGDAPNYTIAPMFMERVQEIVGWATAEGFKVIINVHHDCDGEIAWNAKTWINLGDYKPETKKELYAVWYQIAKAFPGSESNIIFETLNEPHKGGNGWNSSDQNDHDHVKELNQVALRAIRNAGAKNKVSFPSFAANPSYAVDYDTKPTDVMTNALIAAVHNYDPQDVALNAKDNTWEDKDGSVSTYGSKLYIRNLFGRLKTKFVDNNIPVILGECGSVCHTTSGADTVRADYDAFIVEAARNNGIVPVIWDNGSAKAGKECSGLFNRSTGAQLAHATNVISAIMNAATTSTWNTGNPSN